MSTETACNFAAWELFCLETTFKYYRIHKLPETLTELRSDADYQAFVKDCLAWNAFINDAVLSYRRLNRVQRVALANDALLRGPLVLSTDWEHNKKVLMAQLAEEQRFFESLKPAWSMIWNETRLPTNLQCAVCPNRGAMRCLGCLFPSYCSLECMKKDAPVHHATMCAKLKFYSNYLPTTAPAYKFEPVLTNAPVMASVVKAPDSLAIDYFYAD